MKKATYEEAISAVKKPAKITFAVVKDADGKFNTITLEWFMRTSIKPPMLAISVGHSRYSHQCLQDFRYFNLCFPSKEMKQAALISGSRSGRDLNKIEAMQEEFFSGRLAKLPVFKNAAANFECEIITQVRSGDHTIFVGQVKYSWLNKDKDVLLFTDL
jgi:flavin reductase (DIM6/NTAB) family NADH-FMN oxidoreductase RutF